MNCVATLVCGVLLVEALASGDVRGAMVPLPPHPRLLLDAWQGVRVAAPQPRLGVRCRHLPDELRHVWSKLRAPELGLGSKAVAAAWPCPVVAVFSSSSRPRWLTATKRSTCGRKSAA